MIRGIVKTIKAILIGVLVIVASWIMIHVLAVVGILLSFAYPVWWILFPKQSVCFSCRFKKEGEMCEVCKAKISRSTGYAPKTLRSVFINGLFIFFLALASIFFIFLEREVLLRTGIIDDGDGFAEFVIPSEGQYSLGEIFPLKIEISGVETPINVVQADLGYDKDVLEVVDFTITDSFATVFVQKEINNDFGYARLTGGVPNPGLIGSGGVLGTVYFRTKSPGLTQVKFLPTSMVLANDGKGTNVIKEYPTVSYLILSETISPEQKALQDAFVSSNILGASDDVNKLVLFEKDSSVLGAADVADILGVEAEYERASAIYEFFMKFLEVLKQIDHFIIDMYSSLFK